MKVYEVTLSFDGWNANKFFVGEALIAANSGSDAIDLALNVFDEYNELGEGYDAVAKEYTGKNFVIEHDIKRG